MSDSILDKVISRKEDVQKEQFDPLEVVTALLTQLSGKESDVIRRRFGIESGKKETLEAIGSAYSVTRERIRQIESQAIKKIRDTKEFEQIARPVEQLIIALLENHGGVMTREMLFDQLLGVHQYDKQHRQAVAFIVQKLLSDKITSVGSSKKYRKSWRLKVANLEAIDQVIEVLRGIIIENGRPQTFEEIYTQFVETELYQSRPERFTEGTVYSVLDVSAELGRNPFDEYGLAEWGLISPKRMNDRVYLVLQKTGEPMHFEDIAEEVTKVFDKKAYPPTVHNELILNEDYVLVGRGIYALKNWGYKEGVVSEVIMEVLRDADTPLSRSEIVDKVLEQRIVKKNTVHLALTDKSIFHKSRDGKYSLLEERDAKEVNS